MKVENISKWILNLVNKSFEWIRFIFIKCVVIIIILKKKNDSVFIVFKYWCMINIEWQLEYKTTFFKMSRSKMINLWLIPQWNFWLLIEASYVSLNHNVQSRWYTDFDWIVIDFNLFFSVSSLNFPCGSRCFRIIIK